MGIMGVSRLSVAMRLVRTSCMGFEGTSGRMTEHKYLQVDVWGVGKH